MSKKFIAARGQFFKNSNASGEMAHVDRLFAENVNAFPEHTKKNFGSDFKLYDKYKEIHKQRNEIRKSRKDSTTFADINLIFSLDQWEFLEEKYSPEKLQIGMKKMMDDYLLQMKKEFGLEPIGYKFHLDEGHIKQFEAYKNQQDRLAKGLVPDDEKIIEKSDLTRNIHAHVLFYNFDFEKKISPWRKIGKKQTAVMQDIAHESFKKAGFVRGISKEITQKTNKNKEQFVADKLQKQQEKMDKLDQIIEEKKQEVVEVDKKKTLADLELLRVQENIQQEETRLKTLKRSVELLWSDFKGKLGLLVKNVHKGNLNVFYDDVESVQSVIDDVPSDKDDIAQKMVDSGNATTEELKAGKPFKSKKNRPIL